MDVKLMIRHCGIVVSAPARLGQNRLWVRFLAVSDIYPMFIEPTITWVPSGFSGYIWLDTKIVLKMMMMLQCFISELHLFSSRVEFIIWTDLNAEEFGEYHIWCEVHKNLGYIVPQSGSVRWFRNIAALQHIFVGSVLVEGSYNINTSWGVNNFYKHWRILRDLLHHSAIAPLLSKKISHAI